MKVCTMCGAQNDDVFTKCSMCGADLPSPNGEVGDDEKTVLIDPTEAATPKSGFSLKTDTSTYGQADAQTASGTQGQPGFGTAPQAGFGGQGQPGFGTAPQAGFGGQGQPGFGAAPQAGFGGQGQPGFGAAPQAGFGGQGQPGFGAAPQAGFGGQPQQVYAPQEKKPKKGLVIGILVGAAVLLAVAFFLIFKGFGAKGGTNSPEGVAKQLIEAMDEQDVDKVTELCPPFLDAGEDDIQSMIDMYSGYDVTFTYEGVESQTDYEGSDLTDLEEDISDYAGTNVNLQAACDLEFTYNVSITMLGETYDESTTESIVCIKYKGNWYMYE